MFNDDPLVFAIARGLVEKRRADGAFANLDELVAGLTIVAAENRWYYLMQICLPLLVDATIEMQEAFSRVDDDKLVRFLAFGHRINEANYLKLHGRAAVAERLRGIRLPARRWNLPRTDFWVSLETVREALATIRNRSQDMPESKRHKWASGQLRKRCAALNARMMDAADMKLMRHAMATGSQWMRLAKTSEQEAVHVRFHYASGWLSVRLRVAGYATVKRTFLPLQMGKMLTDEERHHIDRHFALSLLSLRVQELLWHLHDRSPIETVLPYLNWFYALLLGDVLAEAAVQHRIASMGSHPNLVVTGHAALAQVPIAALHDGECFMAERFNIVQASPLFAKGDFGVDDIDYETLVGGLPISSRTLRVLAGGEGLHHAAREIDDLREFAQNACIKLEVGAPNAAPWTDETLRWLFASDGVALLSAHMRPSVFEASRAVVVAPDGHEIPFGEALSAPVTAKLVMLSGCLSAGHTDWLAPTESSIVSLMRRAGADSVTSTLWPVEDYSTRLYNIAFIQSLSGGATRAHAHGAAQRAVMGANARPEQMRGGERLVRRSSEDSSSLRNSPISLKHPKYWGGYILTGAWR